MISGREVALTRLLACFWALRWKWDDRKCWRSCRVYSFNFQHVRWRHFEITAI